MAIYVMQMLKILTFVYYKSIEGFENKKFEFHSYPPTDIRERFSFKSFKF